MNIQRSLYNEQAARDLQLAESTLHLLDALKQKITTRDFDDKYNFCFQLAQDTRNVISASVSQILHEEHKANMLTGHERGQRWISRKLLSDRYSVSHVHASN